MNSRYAHPIEEWLAQLRAGAIEDLINYPTGIDNKLARVRGSVAVTAFHKPWEST
jgi:hypothetical protein